MINRDICLMPWLDPALPSPMESHHLAQGRAISIRIHRRDKARPSLSVFTETGPWDSGVGKQAHPFRSSWSFSPEEVELF